MTAHRIEVLDHGYVELIECWGHGRGGDHENDYPVINDDFEVGIIEAARQSTQGSFRGWEEDKKLLNTLYHHQDNQSTPFEAAGMTIEVQAPIFVFREWHRHRTQSYNEASARYSPLPDLYYVPWVDNVTERIAKGRQGKNKQELSHGITKDNPHLIAEQWLAELNEFYSAAERLYQSGLGRGIPKELARLVMPVGHYSKMRASANLRNWLAFLKLRTDSKAQWEIQQFAYAVSRLVQEIFPHTHQLFLDSITESFDDVG